jgi:branched-subunit amino acid aminotransferase/4-amino-4-deoxychorismate lyase
MPVRDLSISLSDPAVLVGMGLFETVALRDGNLLQLAAHLDRLAAGARKITISLPARERLERTCLAAARAESAPYAWLKLLVTRDCRWIVVTGPMDATEEGAIARAVTLPWRRERRAPLIELKTTSYAQNQYAMEHARKLGADEGLWLNSRGHLCEACFSNLFVVRRGALITPAVGEGLLPGIVRATVIRTARAMSVTMHQGRIRRKQLMRADEAFLTSSLCGLRPLVALDGRAIGDGAPGPLTRRLSEQVSRTRRARSVVE